MQIYLTTCLSNGKIYVGKHVNSDPDYYGSGTLIKRAIRKYGKINFSRDIISDKATDTKTLNYLEKFFIKCLDSQNIKVGYNISPGGDGGDIISNMDNKNEIYQRRAKSIKEAWKSRDSSKWGKSIAKGMESTNVERGLLISKGKNYSFSDFSTPDPNKAPANCKAVSIDGVLYDSACLASRELKVSYSTLRNRIKSKSYPTWKTISTG